MEDRDGKWLARIEVLGLVARCSLGPAPDPEVLFYPWPFPESSRACTWCGHLGQLGIVSHHLNLAYRFKLDGFYVIDDGNTQAFIGLVRSLVRYQSGHRMSLATVHCAAACTLRDSLPYIMPHMYILVSQFVMRYIPEH